MANELVLIDLSSIAHPAWHTHQSDPDVNKTSQTVVARVLALASGQPHVAVCCDSQKSFRKELSETYKANRPERDAALHHQITLSREQLAADGFPVWAVNMFEADDLIASATVKALATTQLSVLIVSADKDLLALVGPRVRVMSAATGAVLGPDEVVAKFGVPPDRMRDYLTLVGDKSDNVQGAKNIGQVKAAALLKQFSSLDHLYADLDEVGPTELRIQPAMASSLRDFRLSLATTRALITLREDVPIPFEQVLAPRVAKAIESFGMEEGEIVDTVDIEAEGHAESVTATTIGTTAGNAVAIPPSALTALAVREPEAITPAPAEWERQLDPRSMKDATVLAQRMYESRMFSAYGTPQAVLSTVMLGRELGLPAMGSLRTIHVIEGKHALSASLMVALVLKSGLAEYFEPITFSDKEATYETKRKGARNHIRLTHTIEMAVQAGLVKDKSGWQKNPTDMLVARAQARLARMVYPDLLAGLYTPEELADIKEVA